MGLGVTVEWSEAWEAPRSVAVERDEDLLALLDEVHRGAAQRELPTAAVITRGESALSVVLGIDAIAFLQWMGGVSGSYLGVDVGERAGSGDVIAFSYEGHYSEIPSVVDPHIIRAVSMPPPPSGQTVG